MDNIDQAKLDYLTQSGFKLGFYITIKDWHKGVGVATISAEDVQATPLKKLNNLINKRFEEVVFSGVLKKRG